MPDNLSPHQRLPERLVRRIAIAGSLTIAALLVWQAVTFLALLRTPEPSTHVAAVPSPDATTDSINALFGSSDVSLDNLPAMFLRASFVHPDSSRSSAIVDAADAPGRLVRVGDEVAPGVQIAAVSADHVVLTQGSARLSLSLRPTTSP